jgi:hypothetical protein
MAAPPAAATPRGTGCRRPNETNQYVYLRILVGRTWTSTSGCRTGTMVGYVLALKTGSIGTFYFRVYRPATSVNMAGTSRTMALKVT